MGDRKKAQWQATGLVHAPVEQVWQALLRVYGGLSDADRNAIAQKNDGTVYVVSRGEPMQGKTMVQVDKRQHWIALQGEWWYRGVYTVEPHPQGSLVRYEVFNVAPGIGWWMAQLVQGPQNVRDMERQLGEVLRGIGKQLGSEVRILNVA